MTREEAKFKIRNYSDTIIDTQIENIFDEHEAQLKAKDEEIAEMCKVFSEQNKNHVEELKKFNLWNKLGSKKARSIVAMLFWEWRRLKIIAREKNIATAEYVKLNDSQEYTSCQYDEGACFRARSLFKQAYKMLKDTSCA